MNAQARLGAFILLALALLMFATSRISDFTWISRDDNMVEAEFEDLMGLDVQSPVRMAGVKIGVVQKIFLRHNRAVVRIALNPGVELPGSVRASIISRGLVGEKNLALTAKPGDRSQLVAGAVIPSNPSGDINTFITKATGITDNIRSMTQSLSSSDPDHASLQQLITRANTAAKELSSMISENRNQLQQTTTAMQTTMQMVATDLPVIMTNLKQASITINRLITGHANDLDALVKELPKTAQAGTAFFNRSEQLTATLNASITDNRENLYRSLFELRSVSENLAAFTDDIRRNPWKLMKQKPEVKADKRAQQRRMEEMLMTTGRMGLEPAGR